MATFIEMPKLSDTMTEGTLIKWHVSEGDSVSPGDVIADIETDKATMEMEAFDEGILGKIYVTEGQKAPLGGVLAVLVGEGEQAPDRPPATKSATPKTEAKAEKPAARQAAEPARVVALTTSSGRIKASPLARKIAAQRGIDLAAVAGSGPGGRIVKRDVESAREAHVTPGAAAAIPQAIRPTSDFDPKAERIPLNGMRRVIAERLVASKSTIPHFYLQVEVNAQPLMKLRKQVNESAEKTGNKFTVNDFILKAAVMAAVEAPEANAAWDFDSIIRFSAVNLAVAIAVPDGLVTPVIKNAQDKTMLEISKAVKDLATRAKTKKISPDEFAGGTITVSNLGAYGIDAFDAIINPPQAAILSIGAITRKPIVDENGEIVPGLRLTVGMSCDHRVIDGAIGAAYLQAFRKFVENPALMVV